MSSFADGTNLHIQRPKTHYEDLRMCADERSLQLLVTSDTAGESAFILLDRDDAAALHAFVGKWLETGEGESS
ncbi:MAG: hypothetical protein ACR2OE_01235 [Thermomicrobiales bacterium]